MLVESIEILNIIKRLLSINYLVLIPRYARVNEHKITVEKAIKSFQNEGYTLVDCPEDFRDLK